MSILLQKKEKCTYKFNSINVNVSKKDYKACSLFVRYDHDLSSSLKQSNIEFCIEDNYIKKFTITLDHDYLAQGLSNVEVYFNKYENKTPLILVLYFNDAEKAAPRYCRYSEFVSLVNTNGSIPISKFHQYNTKDEDKEQLLKPLLDANDKLSSILTYQLNNKTTNSNYNNNKITVIKSEIKGTNDTSTDFIKYIHTSIESNNNNNGCVLYDNNVLFSGDIGQYSSYKEIEEIQNQKYKGVSVYWSNKMSIPLMCEFLINKGVKVEYLYYFNNKNKTEFYWEKINQSKYKELLGNEIETEEEVQTKLFSFESNNLIKLLKNIEFGLLNSLTILIDKQNTYYKNGNENIFKVKDPDIIVNSGVSFLQPELINVASKDSECPKLRERGYKVYEQEINIKKGSVKDGENIYLRILIPNKTENAKYDELNFYNSEHINSQNEIKNIYCKYNSMNTNIKVFTYFYGQDPRPLAVMFNNNLFKASSIDTYYEKWIKSGIINSNGCQRDGTEQTLMGVLSEVVGFLNEVKLEEKPRSDNMNVKEPNKKGSEEHTYEVQQYNSTSIKIKVTYSNLNCYRVYKHEPTIDGYRLGNIKYNGNILLYDESQSLSSIFVYYNLYDHEHKYPLLVVLEFKENVKKEYYKLKSVGEYKWEETFDIDSNNIENSLYKIRNQLGVSFYSKNIKETLFDPKNCKEYSNSPVVAGFLVGLSLLGVGVVVAYYKFPVIFTPLYGRML